MSTVVWNMRPRNAPELVFSCLPTSAPVVTAESDANDEVRKQRAQVMANPMPFLYQPEPTAAWASEEGDQGQNKPESRNSDFLKGWTEIGRTHLGVMPVVELVSSYLLFPYPQYASWQFAASEEQEEQGPVKTRFREISPVIPSAAMLVVQSTLFNWWPHIAFSSQDPGARCEMWADREILCMLSRQGEVDGRPESSSLDLGMSAHSTEGNASVYHHYSLPGGRVVSFADLWLLPNKKDQAALAIRVLYLCLDLVPELAKEREALLKQTDERKRLEMLADLIKKQNSLFVQIMEECLPYHRAFSTTFNRAEAPLLEVPCFFSYYYKSIDSSSGASSSGTTALS